MKNALYILCLLTMTVVVGACGDKQFFQPGLLGFTAPGNNDHGNGNNNGGEDSDDGCPVAITDTDEDGFADDADNCPAIYNPDQADANENGIGDLCDEVVNPDPTPTPTPDVDPTPTPEPTPSDVSVEGQACLSAGNAWVCHLPRGNPENLENICIGLPAVDAHLTHGDYLGDCD